MRILSPLSLILILARAFAKEYELGDFVISIDETNTVPNPRLSVTTAQGVVVWKSQEEQDVGKRRLSHDETTADEPDYTDASFRTHHNNPSSSPIIPWKKKSPLPFLAVAVAKVTKGPIIDTFLDMKESIDKSTKTDGLRITDVTKTKKMGKTYEVKITGELYQTFCDKTTVPFTYTFSNPILNSSRKSGESLDFTAEVAEGYANRVYLSAASDVDEKVFGMGLQYTSINHKGKVFPVIISEQGIGRGLEPITGFLNTFAKGAGGNWHTSYACKPQFMTNKNRGAILFNTQASVWDWSSINNGGVEIEVWDYPVFGRLYGFSDPMEFVEMLTEYTGRMTPLPKWTQEGTILGLEGGQEEVTTIVNKVLAAGVQVQALWLQDWAGLHHSYDGDRLQWNWRLSEKSYPDWDGLAKAMKKQGVKMMTYINPYFQSNLEAQDDDDTTDQLPSQFEEGDKLGYFIKNDQNDTYPFFSGSIKFGCLDVTNPDAAEWMKNIIKEEMVVKADSYGWMSDFGEAVPFDAVMSNGMAGSTHHNEFPVWWQKMNREAVDEIRRDPVHKREVVYFSRSGYNRSPNFADVFWLGDQLVTFDDKDGLNTVIISQQSGGLSGHSIQHSDIGGYTIVDYPLAHYGRTSELLLRWIEMEAFSGSMYRSHVGSSFRDEDAQVWDDDVLPGYAKFTAVFAFLKDYRMAAFKQAEKNGWPVVRSAFLMFGEDEQVWDENFIKNHFMFGDDFLVAPVVEAGAVSKSVYFPLCGEEGGAWVGLWGEEEYECGTEVKVQSEVGQPPVFWLKGSDWGDKLKEFVATL